MRSVRSEGPCSPAGAQSARCAAFWRLLRLLKLDRAGQQSRSRIHEVMHMEAQSKGPLCERVNVTAPRRTCPQVAELARVRKLEVVERWAPDDSAMSRKMALPSGAQATASRLLLFLQRSIAALHCRTRANLITSSLTMYFPAMICRSVDLPAPLAPIRRQRDPRGKSREKSVRKGLQPAK